MVDGGDRRWIGPPAAKPCGKNQPLVPAVLPVKMALTCASAHTRKVVC